uniref:Protein transport protein Sec24A n=2 Tax=Cacopsylla melanoneura TaxID=428564 RepID=A0A8D8UJ22_9HEMI
MQQPPASVYQYGAATNPNALVPGKSQQFNSTEVNPMMNGDHQHMDNINLTPSDNSNWGYSSSHVNSESKYTSSFNHQPGYPTQSNVPLNGVNQQNSAFTTVTSSYNYSPNVSAASHVPLGNQTSLPPGTKTEPQQNQFAGPVSFTSNPSVINKNSEPQGGSAPPAVQSHQSTNDVQTSVGSNPLVPGNAPLGSTYNPLTSRGSTLQQSPSGVNGSFPSTMPTNGLPTMSSTTYQPQSSSTSSNSVQPLVSSKQGPPSASTGFFAQPPQANTQSQPSLQSAPVSYNYQPASTSSYSFTSGNNANTQSPLLSTQPTYQPASTSSYNSIQAPLNTNTPLNPIPPVSNSYVQQPSTYNPIRPPVSSNSFQGPTSNNFQPPNPVNNFQAPGNNNRPPVTNSFQAPPAKSVPLRPPASSYSFQAPASANGLQSPPATTAPKLPPLPSSVPQQQQNASYPQQNFRMPPSAYSQPNKQVPLNNGIPPMPGTNQYQQPSNIPPLPNNQPPNQFQPSNNLNNNHQVPPVGPAAGYPSKQPGYMSQQTAYQQTIDQFSNLSVNQGMNKMWGYEPHDLLNTRDILPSTKLEPPPIRLPQNLPEGINCSRDLFRCTLTKLPETKSLLDKSRLPLGLLIHPFKDINNLKVIKTTIVRCRQCRTYINPFVQFLDSKQWKCNICFRTNEIHEQFLYDRNTDMFGDPYRRPEIQSATVEYLATSDYTVRDPPQPAMYLFLLDVSQIAAQSGYLYTVCEVLLNQLKSLPGDRRTSVAIITYDSAVHFYSLAEGQTQPAQIILTDIEDVFLPSPDNILVNLNECYDMIVDLLKQLPDKFKDNLDSGSALGPALQAAFNLLKPTGGRITIFQTCLPNRGPGALESRENPNQRSNDDPPHMNPATDFYKKIALECTSFYIAVDLFILNSQYVDLATLSGVSKHSSGCIHHIPLFSAKNMSHVYQLDRMFSRYLTRKIGFESVMRIRCTKGMSIHTFHGNFFVRSTDLLALPNVNPDAGYGIQISIDESLTHIQYACFQVAVLYTSSKGDRRIRVHTLCLPVVSNVNDVLVGADQQCIAGLLAKMAVDRSLLHSLSDAREAFLNVVCDVLTTYKMTQTGHLTGSLLAPSSLKLLPLFILALLKHPAFRIGQSTRLDDRLYAMMEMKCLPLNNLMLSIYPELYPLHTLDQDPTFEWSELLVPSPRILQLSAERLQATGTYLLNLPESILILVRHGTPPAVCSALFGFQSVAQMPENLYELPQLETPLSVKLNALIAYLNDDKAYVSPVKVMKDSSPDRMEFYDKLIEDKNSGGASYYEFLQRIREQVKNS